MGNNNTIEKRMTLFVLAWPILVETFLRILFVNVDTFMLSGYSDNAAAAVGAAGQYVSIIVILFQVIATGTSIVISQYLGAKNSQKASEAAQVSIVVNFLFGILISTVLFFFTGKILGIMNFEQDVMSYAVEYLTIVGSFAIINAMNSTITAILRSHGIMKISVVVNIGANILNVIGNYISIKGVAGLPVLGVKGVAVSTIFSQSVAMVVLFIVLSRNVGLHMNLISMLTSKRKMLWGTLKEILKIGGPSAGEILSYNISQIAITRIITMMGTTALTARFYVYNIMYFIMICALSIGQATQILIGYLIGAGKIDEAYKACLKSLRIAATISFFTATAFATFGQNLIRLFTDNPEILAMGSVLLGIAIILEPGRALNLVLGNSLRGTGDARFIMYLGFVSMWSIAVGMSYVLGIRLGLGLIGVWIAFASDEWIRGITMYLRWRSRAWEKKAIVKPQIEREICKQTIDEPKKTVIEHTCS